MADTTPHITLPAAWIGNAWQPVWQATGTDDNRPTLHRTICIEWYDGQGIRLISTDSYILLAAWIGVTEERPEPHLDVAPDAETIVADHDKRGLGLIKYAAACARADKDPDGHYHRLRLAVTRPAGSRRTPALADSLEAEVLAISYEGEHVELPIVETPYISWRALITGGTPAAPAAISMSPHVLDVLAKTGANFTWRFAGENGPIRLDTIDTLPRLSGIAMPVRPATLAERTDEEEAA